MVRRVFTVAWLVIFAVLMGGVLLPITHAQQGGPSLQVRAGFDGYYRPDEWLPLLVTVSNEGGEVEGEVRVVHEDPMSRRTVYAQPVLLPTRSRKQFFLYVFGQGYFRQLTVELVARGRVLRKETVTLSALQPNDALVGVVSSSPSTLNLLAALSTAQGGRVTVAHLSPQDLPPQGRAWQALDVLVFNDVDTGVLPPAQREAMAAWVTSGGHLVVTGGLNAAQTAAGVADLLPVDVNGTRTLDDVSALGEFAGTTLTDSGSAVVATGPVREGRVLVAQGDLPLVVRRQAGRGQVTFLALDLNTAPLQNWTGNEVLWQRLLGQGLGHRPGFVVRGGTLLSALASVAPLTLPSPWLVGCFLGSYVLLIGPLNYAILHRLKRTSWAWVTIPVCIVLFSGCAYLTGFQIRGRQAIISQISIIRAWAGQSVASVDSYIALFSPRRGTYQVEVGGAPLLSHLPTEVYTVGKDTSLSVRQGDPATVRDLRVDVGEMRSFVAQSHAVVSSVRSDMHLQEVPDSSSEQMRLVGTLTNEGSAPLEDCLLVLRNYVMPVGDMLPGQTISVDEVLDFSATVGRPLSQQLAAHLSSSGVSERQSQRRQIVQALFGYGYVESGRTALDEGLNLLGWQEGTPLPVTVPGQRPVVHATALWLISLPLWGEGDVVTIPPGFISWEVVESGGAHNPTPYGFYLASGAVTFRFRLEEEFSNLRVQELILYLGAESLQYGGTPGLPAVYLHDWEEGRWVRQTDLAWGANPISNPANYVSPQGTIEVRVSGQEYYELLMLDLSVQGSWPEG